MELITPTAQVLPSIRDQYALAILAAYVQRVYASDTCGGANHLPPLANLPTADRADKGVKVAILGAGAAGLYTAMIINSFNDPGLTCEILESNLGQKANPQRKGGGRLYTHQFNTQQKNDYFVSF